MCTYNIYNLPDVYINAIDSCSQLSYMNYSKKFEVSKRNAYSFSDSGGYITLIKVTVKTLNSKVKVKTLFHCYKRFIFQKLSSL